MEPISNNSLPELPRDKRSRRRHSSAFKAEVLAACNEPGASIAAVAQRFGLNANLIHKWRKAARDGGHPVKRPDFVSVPVPGPVNTGSDTQVAFTLGQLTIQWPISHIERAVPWLKALQA